MSCSKLAKTFLYETMTPPGVRVDPEVYCKYTGFDPSSPTVREPGLLDEPRRESSSSKSSSTIDGADCPACGCPNPATYSMTPDVVRTTAGDVSPSTETVRSSWTPPYGTESGTAINPACNAPRKPTIYSSPCGASITARSPADPHCLRSSAAFSIRRYNCDHVKVCGTPSQSCS